MKAVVRDHTILAITVVFLLIVCFSYLIGHYIGSGYTVEMRYFVWSKPSRLSIANFSVPQQHPVMLVSGPAYERVFINTSKPLKFSSPPHTEGNISCRVVAGYGYYECYGTGYIFEPIGRMMEIISGNEVTKYYYSGVAAGPAGTYVILYGYKFSLFMIVFAVPVVYVLLAYALLKYSYGKFPRESFYVLYIISVLLSTALIYSGGANGLSTVPEDISMIKNCLLNTVYVALVEVPIIYAAVYFVYSRLRMRK